MSFFYFLRKKYIFVCIEIFCNKPQIYLVYNQQLCCTVIHDSIIILSLFFIERVVTLPYFSFNESQPQIKMFDIFNRIICLFVKMPVEKKTTYFAYTVYER